MIIENEIEFSILQAALDCGYITDSLKSVINQSITNYNEYESSINPIIIAVCAEFGTNPGALKSHIRKREIVWSRFVIMDYLYSQRIGTLSMIGAYFGLKYTTVIHAQKRIEEMRRFDKEFAAKYERIMKKISEIKN